MPFALLYIPFDVTEARYVRDFTVIDDAFVAATLVAASGGNPLAVYEQSGADLRLIAAEADIRRWFNRGCIGILPIKDLLNPAIQGLTERPRRLSRGPQQGEPVTINFHAPKMCCITEINGPSCSMRKKFVYHFTVLLRADRRLWDDCRL